MSLCNYNSGRKPRILIANDDGIGAKGLRSLVDYGMAPAGILFAGGFIMGVCFCWRKPGCFLFFVGIPVGDGAGRR